MRVLIQRVEMAKVVVSNQVKGEISVGMMILLGIEREDVTNDADWLIQKICKLRVFNDEEGKMNRSILDIEGDFLVVSQFTLHASTKKGNRPSYVKAAGPEQAIPLYEYFIEQLNKVSSLRVESGIFGAHMKVSLVNDGPVTIMIDTKNRE